MSAVTAFLTLRIANLEYNAADPRYTHYILAKELSVHQLGGRDHDIDSVLVSCHYDHADGQSVTEIPSTWISLLRPDANLPRYASSSLAAYVEDRCYADGRTIWVKIHGTSKDGDKIHYPNVITIPWP